MGWIIEIAKTLGYALVTSFVFVFFRAMLSLNNSKATGIAVIRSEFRDGGYSLVLVGFFTVVLGVLLSRLDVALDSAGRTHYTLR